MSTIRDSRSSGVRLLVLALLGLQVMVACSLLPARQEDCSGSGVLFADEFDGERDCGWVLYSRGGATAEIGDGAMRLTTNQPGQLWWTNPGRDFADVIITVETRQIDGPDDNAYGVICRYQDEANYYIFLISGDGYYAIAKYQADSNQVVYLTPDGQFRPSEAVNQGAATNRIRASCIGNELSLAVNGLPLLTTSDSSFASGDIGLGVSTLKLGTAVVEFDNLTVIAP